jgi:hypothetical protein
MNYAFETGPGALIYTPSFIMIGYAIQKLIGKIHMQTHRQEGDLTSLLSFLQRKESKLKIKCFQNISYNSRNVK